MLESLKKCFFESNVSNLLIYLNIFNVFDAILTLFWIDAGMAEEANPIMEYALDIGPEYFFLCKIALVGMGSILLYRHRNKTISKLVTVTCVSVYVGVCFWHLAGFYLALT